ncbi:uncharacterized protein UHOD_11888 [Ustilago sp. UG-2017b]|nr:uncharacterized protein UHOD_11888 [Ustilago sp. UG-2017b]
MTTSTDNSLDISAQLFWQSTTPTSSATQTESVPALSQSGSTKVARHDQYQYEGDGEVGGVDEDTKVWCSKHGRSTVSMETMDEEACITNSHAKKDQAHMQGGLSAYARRAKRICEEGQAPPRGGPSSRSMQTRATQGFER